MIYFFASPKRSGSHFQMAIITEALTSKGVAFQYLNQEHPEIGQNNVKEVAQILSGYSKIDKLFIAKGHYGTEKLRDMLLRVSNIKIFIIWREVRDQLVSYYYYLKDRRNVSFKGFDDYYWSIGYKFVIEQLEYRKVWTNVNKDPRIRVSHFALLKTDFAYEANKLFSFVGINDIDIDNIKNEVSLESFRKKSGDINGTFYRKGAIDEYKSVISNRKILDNINFIFKCDSKPAMRQLMLVYQQIKKFMMKNGET